MMRNMEENANRATQLRAKTLSKEQNEEFLTGKLPHTPPTSSLSLFLHFSLHFFLTRHNCHDFLGLFSLSLQGWNQ